MNTIATPPGCWLEWAGEFENMLRAKAQLRIVAPATLALLIAVLYLNTKSFVRTGVVLLAVPFSLVGALWMMYALGYHVSIAAWVGMIALMGLDAETGVFMLLFIDLAYSAARRNNAVKTSAELKDAIIDGAAKRMRPKLMTVTAAVVGLLPTLVSTGTGSEIAKRIVAPMVGGLLASFALELLVYPAVYYLWKQPRPVSEPKSALAAKRHY
jgi:Cu(I)/Ag(I) efflux system membrane protein CusA/SilA